MFTEYDYKFNIDNDGDVLIQDLSDNLVILNKDDLERMIRLIETRENEK